MIPVFSPSPGQDELLAIADSFQSGWIGKGPKVDEFEAAWASHIGSNPANVVSINSCTEALFQAVALLGIGPGDEVIIPTIHFVGAAQAVIAAGATPVFCDVNSRTLNVTADHIQAKITNKTKALILNHYGGVPCGMAEITSLLSYHPGIRLIEDAANAPASTFNGQAVGTFGDIGVWSFDAMKIISTGDGGMLWLKDTELATRARKQIYLGTSEASGLNSNKDRWWEFGVDIAGARRSVMNDIAAAMGLEQLKKLPQFIERRRDICAHYRNQFENMNQIKQPDIWLWGTNKRTSLYFYWIQTPKRDELAAYLKANSIYCTFRYYPLHWAYNLPDSLPNAERAARETLLLPLHCGLTDDNVSFICDKVREFYASN
jgi:aminotransferase